MSRGYDHYDSGKVSRGKDVHTINTYSRTKYLQTPLKPNPKTSSTPLMYFPKTFLLFTPYSNFVYERRSNKKPEGFRKMVREDSTQVVVLETMLNIQVNRKSKFYCSLHPYLF